MSALGIIPARYDSSRFPGKPLAKICGVPMLERVYLRASAAASLRRVIVATDDRRIAELCEAISAPFVLTSRDHRSGTDRVAEAARGLADDVIVNLQVDEPLIDPAHIDATVAALEADPDAEIATLARPLCESERDDQNAVKLVMDRRGRALYFSRAAIPACASHGSGRAPVWRHVGLYAYRSRYLQRFVGLPPGELEACEALEQLRALEDGARITVARVDAGESASVDVPEDVARVEALLGRLAAGA